MKTVHLQRYRHRYSIYLPRKIVEELGWKKGDTILVKQWRNKIVLMVLPDDDASNGF